MYAPECLELYKPGGIFQDSSLCKCNEVDPADGTPAGNHAVTLVGYSKNNDTKGCAGYWIV